jgi:hypothetical protein
VVNGKRLVETHSILRAPSASTWVLLRQRGKNVARSGLLAVGGVLYNSDLSQIAKSRGYGVQLSNLPGSQEEADAASQTLGPLLKRKRLVNPNGGMVREAGYWMDEQRRTCT